MEWVPVYVVRLHIQPDKWKVVREDGVAILGAASNLYLATLHVCSRPASILAILKITMTYRCNKTFAVAQTMSCESK